MKQAMASCEGEGRKGGAPGATDAERCPGRRYVSDTLGTVCIPQECMECGRIEDIDAEGVVWIAPQDEPCQNRTAGVEGRKS